MYQENHDEYLFFDHLRRETLRKVDSNRTRTPDSKTSNFAGLWIPDAFTSGDTFVEQTVSSCVN